MSASEPKASAKQAADDPLVGRLINDRFRIVSLIARGGMGRVYRAEQLPLGRLVAVKTLDLSHEGGNEDPTFQQRFFLEASIASKLKHPNTVTVFDYGRTDDDLYFIAMELVEGRSLHHVIRKEAPLAHERVAHIAMQVARSLREAHRLEVIHRDLKPGNVLLTKHADEEDFVKVLDFGLVKHVESEAQQELTKAGLFMGSPKYMAPEQIRDDAQIDARADIYALGVVMYEMLTGKVPFERENTVQILMAHLNEPPPPLVAEGCPPALVQLVMRCLAKKPAQRPASMDELLQLLKNAHGALATPSEQLELSMIAQLPLSEAERTLAPDNQNEQTPPAAVSAPASKRAPKPWWPTAGVLVALAAAAGFLGLRVAQRDQAPAKAKTPPAAVVVPAPAPPAPAPPPAPTAPQAHALVRLNTEPSGAAIRADGKAYGQTPADIEWWGEQATQGRQVSFEFTKAGYETVTVVRELRGDALEITAKLPPLRVARPQPPRPARPKEPEAPVLLAPRSFKKDPY